MHDLLISNAQIVNAQSHFVGHVGVDAGKISRLYQAGKGERPTGHREIDAENRYVVPGGIDGHCHVQQVTGEFATRDTYLETTTSALLGGTTTIIDFAIPERPEISPLSTLQQKTKLASSSVCDVAFHGALISWTDESEAEILQMREMGVPTVKIYTTNRGTTMADSDTISKLFALYGEIGGVVYVHAEHDSIIEGARRRQLAAGAVTVRHLPVLRPPEAEIASVKEILSLARYFGTSVYFVHQSLPECVELIADARRQGQNVYIETCPHYLYFDESVFQGDHPEHFVCSPPFRTPSAKHALRAQLLNSVIDAVGSDHSSYKRVDKGDGQSLASEVAYGIPGVRLRIPSTYTQMVEQDRIETVQRFVDVVAAAPARINGLGTKGVIAPGYDADLLVIDPFKTTKITNGSIEPASDFTPYFGMEMRGVPDLVVSRGEVVVERGSFCAPGPQGRVLGRTI